MIKPFVNMEQQQNQQQRRNFLKTSLTLGAAALVTPRMAIASRPVPAEDFAFSTGPYLQSNFGNEMSISWLTNKVATGWVAYGENAEHLDQIAYGQSALGLKAANSKINCVTLQNLLPGKTYYYRVLSKEIKDFQPYKLTYGTTIQSETASFVNTDVNKTEVSFLMLNDIHDRPQSIPLLVGLDQAKNNDFIFFNGDIFDYQTDEQQIIDHLLKPYMIKA